MLAAWLYFAKDDEKQNKGIPIGQIPILHFGKRMLVPKAAFDKMLGVSPESEVGK